jgi:NAD(P)-dependent dehydrogenase (short-subunit alcohol dehydrogenase family)
MKNYRQLFDLSGKRALVTGAGRAQGIGAAIAAGLSDFDAQVAIHVGRDDASGEGVRNNFQQSGRSCELFVQDLSKPGAGKQLIETVQADFGDIDILVLNAAAQVNGNFEDLTAEQYELQVNVNMRSTFEILQCVLPKMAQRGWGRIVNIGSINQRAPKSIVSIYAATKAAQHNLIQSLARSYADRGVILNTLAPGLVDTHPQRREGNPGATQAWNDYVAQLNWMGRAGQVEEIVGAAVYLSSPACSFMTGEAIFPAGGY